MVLISKKRLVFLIGFPQAPTRAPLGGYGGPRGVEINKSLKIMLYINSRVFKSEDHKNDVIFAFEINSDPLRVHPGVIIGGGAETYIPQKLM